jgi:ABC-type Fe3+-hydroxamate transport system substrate-binding protein
MPIFTDQLDREIELTESPKRIISLVPSQTELLFDLGLKDEVIGITKFCVHPKEWFRNKTRIGGTKTVKVDMIASLHPDLIIANKEENVKEQLEQLEKIAPLWISDIQDIGGAFDMMQSIGTITGKEMQATALINQIKKDFGTIRKDNPPKKIYRTAYLIWKDPYMAAGGDTFINDMMQLSGWQNVLADKMRYPVITTEELKAKNTELILLSSEPFPFKKKHIDELKAELPGVKIILVDGEIFSWYGSRMLYVAEYLGNIEH